MFAKVHRESFFMEIMWILGRQSVSGDCFSHEKFKRNNAYSHQSQYFLGSQTFDQNKHPNNKTEDKTTWKSNDSQLC